MSLPMPAFPRLTHLPRALPVEGAVRIELQDGVPVFRASNLVQERIRDLLEAQRERGLQIEEEEELDRFEEIDDYLSFLNRLVRNQAAVV